MSPKEVRSLFLKLQKVDCEFCRYEKKSDLTIISLIKALAESSEWPQRVMDISEEAKCNEIEYFKLKLLSLHKRFIENRHILEHYRVLLNLLVFDPIELPDGSKCLSAAEYCLLVAHVHLLDICLTASSYFHDFSEPEGKFPIGSDETKEQFARYPSRIVDENFELIKRNWQQVAKQIEARAFELSFSQISHLKTRIRFETTALRAAFPEELESVIPERIPYLEEIQKRYEPPRCPKCNSETKVTSVRNRFRYLKCNKPDCGHSWKAARS